MSFNVNDDPVFKALRWFGLGTAVLVRPLVITEVAIGSILHSGVLLKVAPTFNALGSNHVAVFDVFGGNSSETADLANSGEAVQCSYAACDAKLVAIPVDGAKFKTTHDPTGGGDSCRAHAKVSPISATAGKGLIDNFAGWENGPEVLRRDHSMADELLGDNKGFSKLGPYDRSKLDKGCLDYLILFFLDGFFETLPAPEERSEWGFEDKDLDGRLEAVVIAKNAVEGLPDLRVADFDRVDR